VRDSAPLHFRGTAILAVRGAAAGPAPGQMWENQLAESSISCGHLQKVVQLSKLGFPTSNPSPAVNSLNHGLSSTLRLRPEGEAPCHEKARNRAQLFSK
jgi:hypothetical protein